MELDDDNDMSITFREYVCRTVVLAPSVLLAAALGSDGDVMCVPACVVCVMYMCVHGS